MFLPWYNDFQDTWLLTRERVLGSRTSLKYRVGLSALILFLASPVSAQLGDRLSSYTGRNASGYFEPIVDGVGADLHSGLYHSARIPERELSISLEMTYMSARFSRAERTFVAFTDGVFEPETSVVAPTVVGPDEVIVVKRPYEIAMFPSGFDIKSFDFAAPQLRIGSIYGTEALVRFFFLYTGDADLGNFSLYGLGFRHSVSQYVTGLPIDVAVGAFWQRFSLGGNERGGDIVSADAWTVGLQASKRFSWLEPYAGVAYDNFGMDLSYYERTTPEDKIELSFDSGDHYHMTLGLSINVSFLVVHGEYNSGGQDAFALGLALGYHPLQ
jgi:hypothetical protein